ALVVDEQQDTTVWEHGARLVVFAIVEPLPGQLAGLVRLCCGGDPAQREQASRSDHCLHQVAAPQFPSHLPPHFTKTDSPGVRGAAGIGHLTERTQNSRKQARDSHKSQNRRYRLETTNCAKKTPRSRVPYSQSDSSGLGCWLNDCHTLGVEGDFFMLGSEGAGFAGSSNGSPILARPFFNTTTGRPDAELISF